MSGGNYCAQTVPKICQEYQKRTKYIEEYRKGKGPEKVVPTGKIAYFLRFRFDCGRLHAVKVTGSNPVSPTILLSTTCAIAHPGKAALAPKNVLISRPGNCRTTW
jgi:hypothetical protein